MELLSTTYVSYLFFFHLLLRIYTVVDITGVIICNISDNSGNWHCFCTNLSGSWHCCCTILSGSWHCCCTNLPGSWHCFNTIITCLAVDIVLLPVWYLTVVVEIVVSLTCLAVDVVGPVAVVPVWVEEGARGTGLLVRLA